MSAMFGLGNESPEDAIMGKLDSMLSVIGEVNQQFKNPVRLIFSGPFSSNFYFPVS